MKYLCLLVPQIDLVHLKFVFFFNEEMQKEHANWNSLLILCFQKKPKSEGSKGGGGEGRGDLREHIF